MNKFILAGMIGLICAASANAADIKVSGAWARATAPGQDSAAIQCVLTSSKEARVVGVSSPAANSSELHLMMQMDGMMMMHATQSIPVRANKALDLSAEGYHLMLIGLKKPLKVGDSVPFTLSVEFADKHKELIEAKAEVKPLTATTESHEHHHHH